MPAKPLFAVAVLALVFLAGCSGNGGGGQSVADSFEDEGAPEVQVTETTGGIRGVVVDEAIRPIAGAVIELVGGDAPTKAETTEGGLFAFSGLKAGVYLLKAGHPLYDTQQVSAEVEAGVKEPAPVKILLTRQIFEKPYMQTLKFDGFIVCSFNSQGLLSEECGEGVGSPHQTCDLVGGPCVANPILPGQRIGKQAGNRVQFNVPITEPGLAGIVFEKVWKPTSEAGNELYTPIGLDWVCNPFCGWNDIKKDGKTVELQGGSPQWAQIGQIEVTENEIVIGENVTMFTWAGSFDDDVGLALNQAYQDFMTLSYFLALPEGWSFVNGDEDPFK